MSSVAPKILAIDGATRFGWAVGVAGQIPRSGSRLFAKGAGASHGAVFAGALTFIAEMVKSESPDIIVIEKPLNPEFTKGFSSISNVEVSFGIAACIEGMAYVSRIFKFEQPTVGQIRSHFIGKNIRGDEGKQAVWRKCVAMGWMSAADDDISLDRSDALAVWSYAEHAYAPKLAQPVDDLFLKAKNRAL